MERPPVRPQKPVPMPGSVPPHSRRSVLGPRQYRVIVRTCDQIEAVVNEAIGEGWTPLGGVSLAVLANGGWQMAQAMTRT